MSKQYYRQEFRALPSWEQTRIYFEDAEQKSERGTGINLKAQVDWHNDRAAALERFANSLPVKFNFRIRST